MSLSSPAPAFSRRPETTARRLAMAGAILSSVTLLGCFFRWSGPEGNFLVFPAMHLFTSICLSLLSITLLVAPTPERRREIPWVLALPIAIVAFSLVDILDTLLGHPFRIADSVRMSPVVASMMLLAALATLVQTLRPARTTLWQGLVFTNLFVSGLGLLTYLLGHAVFSDLYAFTRIAAHTALASLCLNLSLLVGAPPAAFFGALSDTLLGGRLARRLIPYVFITVLVTGLSARSGFHHRFIGADYDTGLVLIIGLAGALGLVLKAASALNQADLSLRAMDEVLAVRKKHEEEKSFLASLSRRLDESPDREGRMTAVVSALVPELADYAYLAVLERGKLVPKAAVFRDRELEHIFRAEPRAAPFDLAAETAAISDSSPRFSEDFELSPPLAEAITFPLLVRNAPIGTITFGRTGVRACSFRTESPFLARVADHCALSLENVRLYEEAKSASQAREDVLGVVSHDLKNPLAAIEICVQMLLAKDLSPEKRRIFFHRIESASAHMRRLISDLVDFGKIQAGTFSVALQWVPLDEICSTVEDLYRDSASAKGLTFTCERSAQVEKLRCDKDRIVQVLSNLASNAIKFTESSGSVRIQVKGNGNGVSFVVQDNGVGISPSDLPHVFDRFWQAKSTAALGSGLGLSIAKAIVEAHHGKINVSSQVGAGSVFEVSLPLNAA